MIDLILILIARVIKRTNLELDRAKRVKRNM